MHVRPDNLIQLGLRAHALASRHGLGDRLAAGTLDQLMADIETLRSLVTVTAEARRKAQASTAAQRAALARGYALVRGVRALVRKSRAPVDIRKRYGIGAACRTNSLPQVVSLLEQILNRAQAEPAEAGVVGIAAEDLDNLRSALSAIRLADSQQREMAIASPQTTAERNEAARSIMLAIGRIIGAGLTRFANHPAAQEFDALTGLGGKRRRSVVIVEPTPAAGAEPVTA